MQLSKNPAHSFAISQALEHYASGAIYSFIPKNACSTIRLSLAIANGAIDDVEDVNWIHKNNLTFVADLRAVATAPYTFTILRNPFTRLASCYLDKIVGKASATRALKLNNEETDDLSFTAFVLRIASRTMLRANFHWRPQIDCLVYEEYDDVFRVEDMEHARQRLAERTGLTVVDARDHTLHGTQHLERVEGRFHDVPAHEFVAMRALGKAPAYDALYTPRTAAIVRRVYADDIAAYERMTGHPIEEPTFPSKRNSTLPRTGASV